MAFRFGGARLARRSLPRRGVDVTAENASGCSIDGLFRTLQQLERDVGSRLVGGGRVFYRAKTQRSRRRRATSCSSACGAVRSTRETPVFDTSLTTAADWRTRFERPAGRLGRPRTLCAAASIREMQRLGAGTLGPAHAAISVC